MKLPVISKSKYLNGLQCPKLLWHQYNAKDKIPETGPSLQAIFDRGHEVGELGKKLFPDGIDLGKESYDFKRSLIRTMEVLPERKPVFEASFQFAGAYARADILNPVNDEEWDIIEVKSTTEIKREHLHDLAVQCFIYKGAGIKIRKCFLMHINNEYVRQGDIAPHEFFVLHDITAEISVLLPEVKRNITQFHDIIAEEKSPDIQIGKQCTEPNDCLMKDACWNFLPEHNVTTLYGNRGKTWELIDKNLFHVTEIPSDFPLTHKQKIQVECVKSRHHYVDKKGIKKFLDTLSYPFYFLDFETMNPAIPPYDLTSPYKQIPFQFSLHVIHSPGANPEHHSFLAKGEKDPRPEFLMQLKKKLGSKGSIICYNASFEKGVLKNCCNIFSEYKNWYENTESNFADLFSPFRSFHYYHPEEYGSASMKSILPILTGKSYKEMTIKGGSEASREFMRITFGNVSDDERGTVRKNLEYYCSLDTEGMIWILDVLKKLAD